MRHCLARRHEFVCGLHHGRRNIESSSGNIHLHIPVLRQRLTVTAVAKMLVGGLFTTSCTWLTHHRDNPGETRKLVVPRAEAENRLTPWNNPPETIGRAAARRTAPKLPHVIRVGPNAYWGKIGEYYTGVYRWEVLYGGVSTGGVYRQGFIDGGLCTAVYLQ